jgi:uncharacterized membrane protein
MDPSPGAEQAEPGPMQPDPMQPDPIARAGTMAYDRVLFFSDAVFAIAITLLVVDLRANPTAGTDAGHQLRAAIPGILGFAISFVVIGLFWTGHHSLSRYITAFDRRLIGLNLLFLGTIAFLPYPTDLVSRESAQAPSTIFYACCCAAAGLAETAVWLYATRPAAGLADPAATAVRYQYLLRTARVPAVFLLSIPIAPFSPALAMYFWILLVPLSLIGARMTRTRAGGQGEGQAD